MAIDTNPSKLNLILKDMFRKDIESIANYLQDTDITDVEKWAELGSLQMKIGNNDKANLCYRCANYFKQFNDNGGRLADKKTVDYFFETNQ